MTERQFPDAVRRLADARQAARDARDFDEADRLKAEIEGAGWRVVDQRTSYRLQRAHLPDVVEPDGRVRYGWSGGVPSRLEEVAVAAASVVVVAPDDPDTLERLLAGLAGSVADDVQRIVVANRPEPETEALLIRLGERWRTEGIEPVGSGGAWVAGTGAEIVWTIERLGAAAARNAGIRRAAGDVVILLDASVEVVGDFVTPLVGALADGTVAVAGPWGLVSDDQRHFEAVAAADVGAEDVSAIDLAAMAFRRGDFAGRGPLDEHFVEPPLLDAWWSLVLRDPEGDEMTPRRAVLVDVPLVRTAPESGEPSPDSPADRVLRKNRYRLIGTFGGRRDLAVPRRAE